MEGGDFDEGEFFRAIAASGVRALLIGRRAMVAYGLPVLTADYDLWIEADDAAALNAALAPLGLRATRTPEEARRTGRYVLENDEHVDVLVARSGMAVDGVRVAFADVWVRRKLLRYDETTSIAVPCLDDLILTKRWAMRDKDVADIRLLEALRTRTGGGS
ncbi:MAG: hypothetical protein HY825_02340 [Acidobacteria bacterium]|nr:hypothetical protein [Acidobacteriota bacterium]